MSTSGNSTKGAVSGAGGTRDGLKGSPESSAERASAPARTRNPPRREPRRVRPLLLAAACVFLAALGWGLYRNHHSGRIAATEALAAAVHGDDRAEIPLEQQLEQERTLRQDLEQQLAARLAEQEALEHARRKDVEEQLAARQTDQELLAKERARSNDLEQRLAARQTSEQAMVLALARERAHNQALEQELATRANATPGGERDANVRLSAPASDNPAPPAPIEHTAMPAPIPADKVARTETPALPQAADAEVVRLMARAKRLLEQGDVGAARSVLEHAAESGSALATFALAESYDPIVLSAWGTAGTQGDAAKAQQLYAKAAAGGVEAAKDRLKTLH